MNTEVQKVSQNSEGNEHQGTHLDMKELHRIWVETGKPIHEQLRAYHADLTQRQKNLSSRPGFQQQVAAQTKLEQQNAWKYADSDNALKRAEAAPNSAADATRDREYERYYGYCIEIRNDLSSAEKVLAAEEKRLLKNETNAQKLGIPERTLDSEEKANQKLVEEEQRSLDTNERADATLRRLTDLHATLQARGYVLSPLKSETSYQAYADAYEREWDAVDSKKRSTAAGKEEYKQAFDDRVAAEKQFSSDYAKDIETMAAEVNTQQLAKEGKDKPMSNPAELNANVLSVISMPDGSTIDTGLFAGLTALEESFSQADTEDETAGLSSNAPYLEKINAYDTTVKNFDMQRQEIDEATAKTVDSIDAALAALRKAPGPRFELPVGSFNQALLKQNSIATLERAREAAVRLSQNQKDILTEQQNTMRVTFVEQILSDTERNLFTLNLSSQKDIDDVSKVLEQIAAAKKLIGTPGAKAALSAQLAIAAKDPRMAPLMPELATYALTNGAEASLPSLPGVVITPADGKLVFTLPVREYNAAPARGGDIVVGFSGRGVRVEMANDQKFLSPDQNGLMFGSEEKYGQVYKDATGAIVFSISKTDGTMQTVRVERKQQ